MKSYKHDDTEIEEFRFHQYKSPILINDIDFMKQQYLISFLSVNKILNISLVTKIIKKTDLYGYFFQTQGHTKDTLIRLNVCIL